MCSIYNCKKYKEISLLLNTSHDNVAYFTMFTFSLKLLFLKLNWIPRSPVNEKARNKILTNNQTFITTTRKLTDLNIMWSGIGI